MRGRLLGVEPANGESSLVVVDLDVPEALILAPHILPPTGEVGGRAGAPRAHWYYACTNPPATRRYNGTNGERLVELLARGSQVVVPPSIHPSGEAYRWFRDGRAAVIDPADLQSRCHDLALACTLARAKSGELDSIEAEFDEEQLTRVQPIVARAFTDLPNS